MFFRSQKQLLKRELQAIEKKDFSDLTIKADAEAYDRYQLTEGDGKKYEVEIQYYWDDKEKKNIRVIGSINSSKSLFAFFPVSLGLLILRR